ncbi:MAG: hypothetical protein OXH96_19080 [Spirochaetaceae bacterium]|nr:hypothetical protein [Spirochaetaceae bacterium]
MSQPGAFRNALQVSPLRIATLDDADLNELMRHLLRAQSVRCGCPDASVNAQVDAADEGCDGWSAQPKWPDPWLGNADTCWQFKSGTAGEPARLAGEVEKTIPKRTLEGGGRFVLVASGSTRGRSGEEARRDQLVAEARDAGLPGDKIAVYGSEKLTDWCNQYPAIAARVAGAPAGLSTFDDWAFSEEHRIPYQASPKISSELSRARAQLDFDTPDDAESALHLHVRGFPGVGKTRFALELCRDAAWRDTVLYVRQSEDFRLSALIDTAAEAPDVRLVVVADETQPEHLERLRESVGRADGRVRLITVGNCHSPDPTRIPQVAIEPLDPAAMRTVVGGWYPEMPLEHVEFVINFAAGYLKLGRLAADAVDRDPSATLPNLLARHEIRGILDSLLGEGDRRALYVVAVLTHVGWTDDKQGEGRAIAEHFGLDWNDVRYQVQQFHDRMGIAPRGGRYRYISPEPLALYLAHAAVETFPDLLKSLPDKLPSESTRDAYFKRLEAVASNPRVREYSREQLSRFFFRIDDFVEPHGARRWSAISTADPDLAANNIVRALNSSSTDDRRRITFRALAELVRRLVRIASRTSGFHDAATALALLAEPENESWGNGASYEFVAKYHITLGGTALPYLQRLDVLDELMDLRRPGIARLVVRALAQVGSSSAGGFVMPSSDQVPEPGWQPNSQEQLLECIVAGIDRLRTIAAERDPELQADLFAAAKEVSWLLRYRDAGSQVAALYIRLREAYPELREPLRKRIADTIRRHSEKLLPERLETLRRLHARFEDSSLNGRLRQSVGPHEWERETQPDFASFAAELLADLQVLAEQWPWLTSGQAGAAWELGEALAAKDSGGSLVRELPRLPGGGRDQRIVCGYATARRRAMGDGWYEAWVLTLFEHDPQPVALLLEVVWRCGATDRLARRTAQLLRSRNPSRAIVGQLKYAGWHDTGDAALATLLRALMESGYRETAASILQRRMEAATTIDRWQQLAMELVLDRDLIRCTGMPNHYWHDIAKMMAPHHPREISSTIFQAHAQRDESEPWFLQYEKEVVDVLLACTKHAPCQVWDALRRHLWPPRKAVFFVIGFPPQVLELLPREAILAWIAETPVDQAARRAALVALLTNKQSLSDDSLAAGIIARYGNDEDVSDAFFSHYVSGTFAGPLSSRSRELANNLADISERTALPGLRRWAAKSAAALRTMAESEKQEEEERSLLLR